MAGKKYWYVMYYIPYQYLCPIGSSDFYFFHILRYNHPSLTA